MTAKVLMVQGTMSSAGKSLLVAGLCRLYARRGLRVAPYKAQNMSNNAGVCADGSEIGRAQFTQALACGIEPTAQMNPILLKPEADARSQVVLMGRALDTLTAREYYTHKENLWSAVTASLDALRAEYDLVVIEGAGSAAEVNLREREIVNMAVAKYAQAPVLLAGDIDRGGVFAQLLGTLWLLEPEELALVKGLIVNKFRGDPSLFTNAVTFIEERGGVPVLGVVPYVHHRIPEEDAVAVEEGGGRVDPDSEIDIAVIHLPRISNFDDFDPLDAEPGVSVRYVSAPEDLGKPHAIIIPGTKSTISDLNWLKEQGLAAAVQAYGAAGGVVVGICGGYQMLGQRVSDPHHVESSVAETDALSLLPVETIFEGEKATYQARAAIQSDIGWLNALQGQHITGYEIHMGRTHGNEQAYWLEINKRGDAEVKVADGALSQDGRVWGCYLHGLFENAELRYAWLTSLGWQAGSTVAVDHLQTSFDLLADTLEAALDMTLLDSIIGLT